jgi:hypothetical protein
MKISEHKVIMGILPRIESAHAALLQLARHHRDF